MTSLPDRDALIMRSVREWMEKRGRVRVVDADGRAWWVKKNVAS